jgi:hypothetical protein
MLLRRQLFHDNQPRFFGDGLKTFQYGRLKMHNLTTKNATLIALILTGLMAATRSHHFADLHHLPDASWAVFFLAGIYLRPLWMFPALLLLAVISDWVAIAWFNVSDFCVSPAYAFLLPAYGALWFGGRWYSRRHRFQWTTLFPLGMAVLAGATVCELLSSGSFYFFSGRFPETQWTTFGSELAKYFPHSLESMGLYVLVAILVHLTINLLGHNRLMDRLPAPK